jgi:hypothetical protein
MHNSTHRSSPVTLSNSSLSSGKRHFFPMPAKLRITQLASTITSHVVTFFGTMYLFIKIASSLSQRYRMEYIIQSPEAHYLTRRAFAPIEITQSTAPPQESKVVRLEWILNSSTRRVSGSILGAMKGDRTRRDQIRNRKMFVPTILRPAL